ncbi:MAG TPA: hypothetical protein VGM88_27880 [Kofleriaceae bacterium]
MLPVRSHRMSCARPASMSCARRLSRSNAWRATSSTDGSRVGLACSSSSFESVAFSARRYGSISRSDDPIVSDRSPRFTNSTISAIWSLVFVMRSRHSLIRVSRSFAWFARIFAIASRTCFLPSRLASRSWIASRIRVRATPSLMWRALAHLVSLRLVVQR